MRARVHTHSRDNSDAITKAFYIRYCKILQVIRRLKNSIIIDL